VKPENLMFTEDGSLKIADFGRCDDGCTVTIEGTIRGTLAYLAPE
jgi:serine/threonine protein kinase